LWLLYWRSEFYRGLLSFGCVVSVPTKNVKAIAANVANVAESDSKPTALEAIKAAGVMDFPFFS